MLISCVRIRNVYMPTTLPDQRMVCFLVIQSFSLFHRPSGVIWIASRNPSKRVFQLLCVEGEIRRNDSTISFRQLAFSTLESLLNGINKRIHCSARRNIVLKSYTILLHSKSITQIERFFLSASH